MAGYNSFDGAALHNRFTYHPPRTQDRHPKHQTDRYEDIRSSGLAFAAILNDHCPGSRELSLAMTKLEEAVMWANAAIARNE